MEQYLNLNKGNKQTIKSKLKRTNNSKFEDPENQITDFKRARPQLNFYSKYEETENSETETAETETFIAETAVAETAVAETAETESTEAVNKICNQATSIENTSGEATETLGSQTALSSQTTTSQTIIEPPSDQKPKTRKSAHDWMGPVVEEMLIVGNSSISIMRIINQFIITTGIEKKLVSQSTIRRKINEILLKHSQKPNIQRQSVIGFDARGDLTLALKNQLIMEEHMTFVDTAGNYIDHRTLSNKKSTTISGHVMDILEKCDSFETIQILKTDGESANTGRTVNDVVFTTPASTAAGVDFEISRLASN